MKIPCTYWQLFITVFLYTSFQINALVTDLYSGAAKVALTLVDSFEPEVGKQKGSISNIGTEINARWIYL